MTDIKTIPLAEILADRLESLKDAAVCDVALRLDIKTYGDGLSVAERRQTNLDIVKSIDAELVRRRICPKCGAPIYRDDSMHDDILYICGTIQNSTNRNQIEQSPECLEAEQKGGA